MKIQFLPRFYILCTLLLLSVLVAKAQKERKDLYEIEEHKNIFGTKYIYDRQHTRNPLILQIPILQAKDSEASFEFLKYQNRKKMANILGILPTGLSIYALFNAKGVSDALYWTTAGATFLLSSYIDYKANQHLKNAVARYNFVIKSSHVSFEIEKLNQNHGTSMGVGFAHSF